MTCDHRSEAPFIARGRMRKFMYPRAEFYLANAVTLVYTMKLKAQSPQS